jgi:hypothetical protein
VTGAPAGPRAGPGPARRVLPRLSRRGSESESGSLATPGHRRVTGRAEAGPGLRPLSRCARDSESGGESDRESESESVTLATVT